MRYVLGEFPRRGIAFGFYHDSGQGLRDTSGVRSRVASALSCSYAMYYGCSVCELLSLSWGPGEVAPPRSRVVGE